MGVARKFSLPEIRAMLLKMFWPRESGTSGKFWIPTRFCFCWDLVYETGKFSQNLVFFTASRNFFFFAWSLLSWIVCQMSLVGVVQTSPRCLSWWLFRRSWNRVDSNWRSWYCWAGVLSTRPRSSCWENNFGTSLYIVRLRNLDRNFF